MDMEVLMAAYVVERQEEEIPRWAVEAVINIPSLHHIRDLKHLNNIILILIPAVQARIYLLPTRHITGTFPLPPTQAHPRPSPLSQGTTSFHSISPGEKRMSRDDTDLAAMMREEAATDRLKSGLKGRLRRALTFGTTASTGINEESEIVDDDDESIKASRFPKSKPSPLVRPSTDSALSQESGNTIQTASTTLNPAAPSNLSGAPGSSSPGPPPVQKKRGRAASLFNSRLNASTDNISLSSTVSSASVMIRKLGSMGKLARRNSLAGITSLFKDKKKKDDVLAEDDDTGLSSSEAGGGKDDKKKKKKKEKEKKGSTAKATVSEASVSHVTAELDRGGSSSGEWNAAELAGLSPAAKLARQHTLKSNAEAAAKERERLQKEKEEKERETAAAAVAAAKANGVNGNGGGVPVWDRGTHNRSPVKGGGNVRVNEDGTRVVIEDDDDEEWSEDGHGRGVQQGYQPGGHAGWDDDGDDDDWDGEDEEDVTIRIGMDRVDLNNATAGNAGGDWGGSDETEVWAAGVRRSVERTRVPSKGILKYATNYDQHAYLADTAHPNQSTRVRSNSYNSHPSQQNELGPLARIPSPDPDHIDGLHRHGSHSSGGHGAATQLGSTAPSLPPLSFDNSPIKANMDVPQKPSNTMFSHSNSSAPALSLSLSSNPPTLTHRSATAPSKRLAFANNLSVYDTFSSSVYDRRSEPATWSRLTPALAQRIKEELNSYKMEEMEVHAASRIHTQFFV
ncbi:hypothetical protein L218DRAFT_945686 [Marasmius fiardii PR-910]|nr:hypothetical protein L218DRAFT_945686 [Marasmius fiardii PR-910]